ncbi:MAG: hypothetical protein GY867_12595 [bacterium]|nr:hypothetical protein [bacterium]
MIILGLTRTQTILNRVLPKSVPAWEPEAPRTASAKRLLPRLCRTLLTIAGSIAFGLPGSAATSRSQSEGPQDVEFHQTTTYNLKGNSKEGYELAARVSLRRKFIVE